MYIFHVEGVSEGTFTDYYHTPTPSQHFSILSLEFQRGMGRSGHPLNRIFMYTMLNAVNVIVYNTNNQNLKS